MRATIVLIVINCIVYLLGEFIFDRNILFAYFGLNYLSFSGAWWQVFTTMFLHANFWHIAMNMAVLYQFGSVLERFLGSLRFAFIYLLGGILTSVLSLAYTYFMLMHNGTVVNLVGASGAISVLLGLLAFLDKRIRKGLVLAIFLISFIPMFLGVNVGWYAHILGFIVGYVFGKVKFGLKSRS
ncbi:MAG: rhomboid family intramembrane serine protease [Campylobacter sp.]|nr:rhomboid family intramembrane serine protease [Campylobacter sp.]